MSAGLDGGDWTAVPNEVLLDARLSADARLLWAILRAATYRPGHGAADSCRPTQAELGEWLGVQTRQVRRYVAELREAGLIEVRQHGFGKAATYDVPLRPGARSDMTALARSRMAPSRGHIRPGLEDEDTYEVPPSAFSEKANGNDLSPSRAVVARARPPVTHRRRRVPDETVAAAMAALAHFNDRTGSRIGAWTAGGEPSAGLRRIIGAMVDYPEAADLAPAMIDAACSDPYWDGRAQPGNVFGPGVVQRYIEQARSGPPGPLASNPALAAFVARSEASTIDGTATDLGESP